MRLSKFVERGSSAATQQALQVQCIRGKFLLQGVLRTQQRMTPRQLLGRELSKGMKDNG